LWYTRVLILSSVETCRFGRVPERIQEYQI